MKAKLIRMKDVRGNVESVPTSWVPGYETGGWQKIDESGKRIPVKAVQHYDEKTGRFVNWK